MSTIIVAAILVGIILVAGVLFVRLDKKQKRKAMNQLHQRFSRLGTENDLRFSSQESFNDFLLGLDGVHRKLLVLKNLDETVFHSFIVDLNEVKSCSVRKSYGTINGGELKTKKLEQYLEKIVLRFEFINGNPPKEVPFYRHVDNHIYEVGELEQKAKDWEVMLSKMLTPMKKIA